MRPFLEACFLGLHPWTMPALLFYTDILGKMCQSFYQQVNGDAIITWHKLTILYLSSQLSWFVASSPAWHLQPWLNPKEGLIKRLIYSSFLHSPSLSGFPHESWLAIYKNKISNWRKVSSKGSICLPGRLCWQLGPGSGAFPSRSSVGLSY